MNLDEELKAALSRKSPPAGFAERVVRNLPAERSHGPAQRAVAAALLLTAVLGGWTAREIRHQKEGERAREEVLTALRITTEKLRSAKQHVQNIGMEGR